MANLELVPLTPDTTGTAWRGRKPPSTAVTTLEAFTTTTTPTTTAAAATITASVASEPSEVDSEDNPSVDSTDTITDISETNVTQITIVEEGKNVVKTLDIVNVLIRYITDNHLELFELSFLHNAMNKLFLKIVYIV